MHRSIRGETLRLFIATVTTLLMMSACHRNDANFASMVVAGGNPDRGATEIETFGCGRCHEINGIRDATGKVGPPLTNIVERSFIAGEVANTPDNMVRWIHDPQSIEPNTAMPNLGVSDVAARDIAAYLYTKQ